MVSNSVFSGFLFFLAENSYLLNQLYHLTLVKGLEIVLDVIYYIISINSGGRGEKINENYCSIHVLESVNGKARGNEP